MLMMLHPFKVMDCMLSSTHIEQQQLLLLQLQPFVLLCLIGLSPSVQRPLYQMPRCIWWSPSRPMVCHHTRELALVPRSTPGIMARG